MAHNRKLVLTWCGRGLRRFIFGVEFEILELDPPINATSHYELCHSRYDLALIINLLKSKFSCNSNIFVLVQYLFEKCISNLQYKI